LRRYETTFIVNPQADDAAIDRQVTAVADLIKNDGGQILNERRIGTRRLAYPIAGLVQGFYASFIFDAENTVLPKLERHYKLEEPYVRHLTIRFDGQLSSTEEETKPTDTDKTAKAKPVEKPDTNAPAETAEAKPVEKPDPDAPAETTEAEAKPDPEPAVDKPAPEEPVTEAPAIEEPTPEAPKAVEPPAESAKPTEPSDSADEEL